MVSVLEILSDEVMMELFAYWEAYHLFKTFFNLNSRFKQLLKDHRLRLTFHSKNVCKNEIIDTEMWPVMLKYLTAITLINNKHIRMLMSVCKENDFTCLESLTLRQVRVRAGKKI